MLVFKVKLLIKLFKNKTTFPYFSAWLKAFFEPRGKVFAVKIFGRTFRANDSVAFLAMAEEILGREIYDFPSSKKSPRILDCGLNIGLASFFWKKKYPDAEIIAFEPDAEILALARQNLAGLVVQTEELAVWSSETELSFSPDGVSAGRIEENGKISVKTARLKNYLQNEIDFLKIDIEGAETEVLRDCAGDLKKVKALFVEYHSFQNEKQSLAEILTIIQAAGFRFYLEHNGIRSTKPFQNIEHLNGTDNFVNIFAYRTP
jgi:FkbM family methyltransferase